MNAGHALDLDSRAISYESSEKEGAFDSLPKGDWNMNRYRGKTTVGCGNPKDLKRIKGTLGNLISDSTAVYHVYGGIKICDMGTMREVLDEWEEKTGTTGKSGLLDLSDLLVSAPLASNDFSEEKTVKTDPNQIIDMLGYRSGEAKTARIHESRIYEKLFESRPELGMKVVRYTRTDAQGNKKDEFRYMSTVKKNRRGGFIGRDYAMESVKALAEYDSLMKRGTLESTRKARLIAEDYFSEKGYNEAERKIADLTRIQFRKLDLQKLRERRSRLFGAKDNSSGRMQEVRVALNTYDKLLRSDNWVSLRTAGALADVYFRPEEKQAAFRDVNNRLEMKAVRVGETIKNFGIVHPENAQIAYQVLSRTGKDYNIGLAKGIGDMYFNLESGRSVPPPIPADAGIKRNMPPPIPADAKMRRKTPPPLPARARMRNPTVPEIPSLKKGDFLPKIPYTIRFPEDTAVTLMPQAEVYAT